MVIAASRFGISYTGITYLLMLFLLNLLWTKYKPKDYEKYAVQEDKRLLLLERVGEVLVSCAAVVFPEFNIRPKSGRLGWLAMSFALMLLYEVFWIRYFRSGRTLKDFYSSMIGIPVAGATLPVCAFLLLGVYGQNLVMIFSTLILGIGHIGIHLNHRKELW